jgi:hypothetical protein
VVSTSGSSGIAAELGGVLAVVYELRIATQIQRAYGAAHALTQQESSMTISIQRASVPAFVAMLTNIKTWLDKAAAQKPEAELFDAKLAEDMFALARQVQIVSDTAKGAIARLAGSEAPAMPDTETSFAQLKDRLDKTIAYVQSLDTAALEAGAAREIAITFPNGGGVKFDGLTYLTGFVLPNFYFHASMVYAILRAQGIEIGKFDFLAHLAPNMFAPPEPVAG